MAAAHEDSRGDVNGFEPQPIRSVSVIGAGLMGRGIALAAAQHGIAVTLSDACEETLARSFDIIRTATASTPKAQGSAHRAATSDADVASADLVIEAVVESLQVKKQIFSRVEPLAGAGTIFASNTSCLRISEIGACFARPERFCGLHFCHPVADRSLVEVVRGERSSEATLSAAERFVQRIGKLPIVVADGPGFVVNRLLLPYLNEAVQLLCERVDLGAIEEAAISFGMPWGPITQLDSIGIDVAVRGGAIMHRAFPDRVLASELLIDLYKSGRLGEKTGAGFFTYDDRGRRGGLAAEVIAMIEDRRVRGADRGSRSRDRDAIARRLFLPMLVEATRLVEEGIVADARDIDRSLVHGLAFLPAKGGILAWADRAGAGRIVEWLTPLAALGERYRPTPLLLETAQRGGRFLDGLSREPAG